MIDEIVPMVPRKLSRRRDPWLIAAVVTSILLVLALALGLGLGLGLKNNGSVTDSGEGSQAFAISAQPFLVPQTSENFVVGSIVGQHPQDRRYYFTIALANGAPDGVNKTMLVVNGVSSRLCAVTIILLCVALRRLQRFLEVVWQLWNQTLTDFFTILYLRCSMTVHNAGGFRPVLQSLKAAIWPCRASDDRVFTWARTDAIRRLAVSRVSSDDAEHNL
jgi:hypothetical protein